MSKTMAGPPKISKTQTMLSKFFLKVTGWKVEGSVPNIPKFVAILAPHTSNWDLPFILAVMYVLSVRLNWFGKKEIFRWPVGVVFKWLGGIPIERSTRQNMVQQTAQTIQRHEQIIVGLSPEGTRSQTGYWKTGFYYIAHEAQVPIVFAYLDYARKVGGFGPVMETTGDIEADMKIIREFYSGITAKYPHEAGEIAIRPPTADHRPPTADHRPQTTDR
ncbi:MAG: lysophospholipid acyltransferase family protein [Chloroflexi bacterium]|nr:lysophospholipid acyltransferase family protein [Chloroflexota bacterium]